MGTFIKVKFFKYIRHQTYYHMVQTPSPPMNQMIDRFMGTTAKHTALLQAGPQTFPSADHVPIANPLKETNSAKLRASAASILWSEQQGLIVCNKHHSLFSAKNVELMVNIRLFCFYSLLRYT